MAQLKEIKSRIQSVRSTQKITSAMMMISSARLRKAQNIFEHLIPYEQHLYRITQTIISGLEEEETYSPLLERPAAGRIAIVVFASNTGLAGRFNDNICEKLKTVVKEYMPLGKENILLYPIGEKVMKTIRSMGFEPQGNYSSINGNLARNSTNDLAGELMEMFAKGDIDRVELIYSHYRSKGSQVAVNKPLLPIELKTANNGTRGREATNGKKNHKTINSETTDREVSNGKQNTETYALDYIIEPDRKTIMSRLIPEIVRTEFFSAHIEATVSEHAARMTAMQIATDNADELTEELTLEYNKLRQQSITNELLDIVGGSFDSYS